MLWVLAFLFLAGVSVGIVIGVALAIAHRDRLDEERVRALEKQLRDGKGLYR